MEYDKMLRMFQCFIGNVCGTTILCKIHSKQNATCSRTYRTTIFGRTIIRNMGGIPAKIWVLANTIQFFSLTPPEMSSTNIDT